MKSHRVILDTNNNNNNNNDTSLNICLYDEELYNKLLLHKSTEYYAQLCKQNQLINQHYNNNNYNTALNHKQNTNMINQLNNNTNYTNNNNNNHNTSNDVNIDNNKLGECINESDNSSSDDELMLRRLSECVNQSNINNNHNSNANHNHSNKINNSPKQTNSLILFHYQIKTPNNNNNNVKNDNNDNNSNNNEYYECKIYDPSKPFGVNKFKNPNYASNDIDNNSQDSNHGNSLNSFQVSLCNRLNKLLDNDIIFENNLWKYNHAANTNTTHNSINLFASHRIKL